MTRILKIRRLPKDLKAETQKTPAEEKKKRIKTGLWALAVDAAVLTYFYFTAGLLAPIFMFWIVSSSFDLTSLALTLLNVPRVGPLRRVLSASYLAFLISYGINTPGPHYILWPYVGISISLFLLGFAFKALAKKLTKIAARAESESSGS